MSALSPSPVPDQFLEMIRLRSAHDHLISLGNRKLHESEDRKQQQGVAKTFCYLFANEGRNITLSSGSLLKTVTNTL